MFYLYFSHPTRGSVACCHATRDGSQGDAPGLGYQELPSSLSALSEEKLLLRVRSYLPLFIRAPALQTLIFVSSIPRSSFRRPISPQYCYQDWALNLILVIAYRASETFLETVGLYSFRKPPNDTRINQRHLN